MSSELPACISALRIKCEERTILEITNSAIEEGWIGTPIPHEDVGLILQRGKTATVEYACPKPEFGVLRLRDPSALFASRLQATENTEWVIRVRERAFDVEVIGGEGALQRCGSQSLRLLRLSNALGELVLSVQSVLLPILVVSSKLPGEFRDDSVESLLEWVWDHHWAVVRQSGGMTNLPLSVGQCRGRSPVQTLLLLEYLLKQGGVRQALQQLLFEPRHALRIDWPIVPIGQARCPALHGPRGPWTIPGAFDASDNIVKLQDRRPKRTIDTLPMRLGKRLAWRIAELARNLQSTLMNLKELSLASRARRVLTFANQTVSHPDWEDLSVTGPLPLDSPQLHLDPVCQPLLRAWLQLESGFAFRDADEALFRDPLRESFALYEYAVWFALVDELAKHATNVELDRRIAPAKDLLGSASVSEGLRANCVLGDGREVALLYNATFWGKKSSTSETGSVEPMGTGKFNSWSEEFRPDYVLKIDEQMHILDAKYRVDNNGEAKQADFKAMHAYRDALRGPSNERVGWATVIYPGETPQKWCEPLPGNCGVNSRQWAPGHSDNLSKWITELLRPQ